MEIGEAIKAIFQYGGTAIMAALFVWVFIEDKKKNQKMLEENTSLLQALTTSNNNNSETLKTLAQSNNNIAKSLDIITNNLVVIDTKIDRNYEVEVGKRGE